MDHHFYVAPCNNIPGREMGPCAKPGCGASVTDPVHLYGKNDPYIEVCQRLAVVEHKIDQHLQGQYPDGKALGVALAECRAALLIMESLVKTK